MSDQLSDFRCTMTMTIDFVMTNWSYVVEGKDGAIEFRVTKSNRQQDGIPTHWGGVELHYASPPSYSGHRPPDHGRCRAISERACWHDGSSLIAEELWIPRWKDDPNNHEMTFHLLVAEYRKRFCESQAAESEEEAP